MNTFLRFFYEFISVFFDGFFSGIKGLIDGFRKMFGFSEYSKIISSYKDNFNVNEKFFAVICILFLVIFIIIFVVLFVFIIKAIARKFGNDMNKDNLSFKKPKNLNKMIELSKKLAEDFDYVRVDLYESDGKIYFGELTFTDGSGYDILQPDKYDIEWGKYC